MSTQKSDTLADDTADDKAFHAVITNMTNGSNALTTPEQQGRSKCLLDEILNDPVSEYVEQLKKIMHEDKCRQRKEGVFDIRFDNCAELIRLNCTPGEEAIRIKGASFFHGMSDEVADDAMKLAAARGWASVDLKGPYEKKEKLWYAAKMNGIGVTNFEPKAGSPIFKKLEEDLAAKQEQMEAENSELTKTGSKFASDELKGAAPEALESPKSPEAPKSEDTFKTWLHEKAETAPTKEAQEGLKKIAAALDKGLNVGDTEKAVFMSKYESAVVDLKGKPTGGYNNAVPMIEQMAQVQKIDLSLPKIPETAAHQIILPPSAKNKNPEP